MCLCWHINDAALGSGNISGIHRLAICQVQHSMTHLASNHIMAVQQRVSATHTVGNLQERHPSVAVWQKGS